MIDKEYRAEQIAKEAAKRLDEVRAGSSKSELLPCPFCGGEAEIMHLPAVEPSAQWHIHCANRDCEVDPFLWRSTEAEAIAAWNSRAERTCRNASYRVDESRFHCSECGSYVATWDAECDVCSINYCPNCGAKVVSE